MKKKLLAFILAASLMVGSVPISSFAATLPFEDVPTTAWYYGAVEQAYKEGLFKGVSETEFDPEGTMTRGMFVTVLANMTSDYDETAYAGDPVFDDVAANDWFAAPVNWAIEHELTEGIGDNLFDPEGKVTREQMAMFMYKYAIASGNDLTFTEGVSATFVDATSVSSWAKTAVDWAVTHKVINGDDNNHLNPGDDAQRCEVAQVAINAKGVLTNTSLEETPTPSPTPEVPSGGGGGGGPVAPPDPTPTPTPTPSPMPTPDYDYADKTKIPELREISGVPDGAMSYDEFCSIFSNAEQVTKFAHSLQVAVYSERELTTDELERIHLLGEDIQNDYLYNLSLQTLSEQNNLIENNYPRDEVIAYISVDFFSDYANPDGARRVGLYDFRLPCNDPGYIPDGIDDELELLAFGNMLNYKIYVDPDNPDKPYYADPLTVPEPNVLGEIPEGAITYEEFCNLFSNHLIEKTSFGELNVTIYNEAPLTDDQLQSIQDLGRDLQVDYCENLLFACLNESSAQAILKNDCPRKEVVDGVNGYFYSDYANEDGAMSWGSIGYRSAESIYFPDGKPNELIIGYDNIYFGSLE